ncbi:MAG: ABC transporter substrate-binding protein [Marivibrio sp.]|uniref:ABC transporter substrate-binding protein n=1 Tax=Marivibrio sp. TaxID=2039719 RepID=UPI0032EF4DDC
MMNRLRAGLAAALCLIVPLVAGQGTASAQGETSAVIGMTLEPPHLDPTAGAAAAIDEVVYANVFEGLTRIDAAGAVQPALARSWEISEDGTTYTFALRRGVTFHDGADFDAQDVIFTYERAMAEGSVNAQKQLFSAIESMSAPDDHTLVIELTQPQGLFLWNMGWGDAVIVDPATAETNKTNPIGTGPFAFDGWTQGDNVRLKRNDAYWGDAPALERATFKFIPDAAAQVAALLAGDIDAFPNMGAPETVGQFQADPRFDVYVGTTEGETILSINHRRAPWSDVRVRRAIQHAIDRQALIDLAMFGFGTPIGSHFAPHHPAYIDLTGTAPYDPAKAAELMEAAGVETPLRAVMKLPPPTYARRGGEIIAAQLKAVGIELELVPVEWGQWLAEVFKAPHDFDFTIVSHTEPLDIGIYAREDYYFGYENPSFVAHMAELEVEADPVRRAELLVEAQEMIADDQVNGFLFQLAKVGVKKAGLEGLWLNAPVQANDLTAVRWE